MSLRSQPATDLTPGPLAPAFPPLPPLDPARDFQSSFEAEFAVCRYARGSRWPIIRTNTNGTEASMIVAIGRFYLRADKISHFEAAWLRVCPLLTSKPGYRGHRLGPQCEDEGCYVLEVEWDSLDAQSAFMMHGDFRTFLHALWPYFSADPDLYHFEPLAQPSRFPAI